MKDDNSTDARPYVVFVTTVGDVYVPHERDRPLREALREALVTKFGTAIAPDVDDGAFGCVTVNGDRVDLDSSMREADVESGDYLFVEPDPAGGI